MSAKSTEATQTHSPPSPSHPLAGLPSATRTSRRAGIRRHPLLSSALAVGDRKFDFERFAAAMLAELKPQGAVETVLAARAVGVAWRLNRAQAFESTFLSRSDYGNRTRAVAGVANLRDMRFLEAMQRWEAGQQKSLLQLLDALERRDQTQMRRAGEGEDEQSAQNCAQDRPDLAAFPCAKVEGAK